MTMKKGLILLAVALLGGAAMAQQYDTLSVPDGLNVPRGAVCDYSMMLSAPSLRQEEAPAIQTVNLSCAQYDCNPKPWAIGLAAVSGTSFIAGTWFIAWGHGYYRSLQRYYRYYYDYYHGDVPMNLTYVAAGLLGLTCYAVSIGTGIPSIILFKKAGRNAQSEAPLACHGSELFPNGVQCGLGVQPGGFGINIDF